MPSPLCWLMSPPSLLAAFEPSPTALALSTSRSPKLSPSMSMELSMFVMTELSSMIWVMVSLSLYATWVT
jgi:hypothetical protein